MAEIRNCSTSDQLPDEEVAQRMDRAVLRMMATPPQPRKTKAVAIRRQKPRGGAKEPKPND